jgi:hypothetical protein
MTIRATYVRLGNPEAFDHREQGRHRADQDVGDEQAAPPEEGRDLPAPFMVHRGHHPQAESVRGDGDGYPGQVDLITDHDSIVRATDS